MLYKIAELQYKELVDINSGAKYGFISDLEINTDLGRIENVIVYGKPRALGFLGRNPDVVFPWHAIKRIGADLILVDSGKKEEK